MFREHKQHLQGQLYSTVSELPAAQRHLLEASWAGVFRHQVFAQLDESAFAVMYASKASRPNVPVNVLMGLEILKSGFGWTDEEMYQAFLFNLQVRYALGYEQLGTGYFAMRTVYELRRRLRKWMQETGENLVEGAFKQITDVQIKALTLKTETLRMDSTQIASDICKFSRLQLLVEILQRVQRMLSERDRERYASLLAPYVATKASRYVYRLKASEMEMRLAAIGAVMAGLVAELAAVYAQASAYGLLVRVFDEHFVWTQSEQRLKTYSEVGVRSLQLEVGGELNATILRFPRSGQSADDLEIVSRGNRNAYNVLWAPLPVTLGEPDGLRAWQLFASENGPDFNDAPDEVNHIRWDHHYGFPEQFGPINEPEIEGDPYSGPVYPVTAHASADGLAYIDHPDWPVEYRTLYVALFGEVFNPIPVGHIVERISLRAEKIPSGEITYRGEPSPFVVGLDRPLPLVTAPDGNMLVGDYATGVIYKITYMGTGE